MAMQRFFRSTEKATAPFFRQLFEPVTSTYTYLLADIDTKEAVLIDPVDTTVDRDIAVLEDLDLKLKYALNTHVHADHITGTGLLKKRLHGVQSVLSDYTGGAKSDVQMKHLDKVSFGKFELEGRHTPGHTAGCMSYLLRDLNKEPYAVFTGDCLLIRGCGRTDFQQGDSTQMYFSVHKQLFTLPDDTIVYPAHDYKGRTASTIGEEKKFNPRVTKSHDDFVTLMANLNLPRPRFIDQALPANMKCGVDEDDA